MKVMGKTVVPSERWTIQTPRSWRERLFVRPWRPWKKTNTEPDPGFYITATEIHAHPATVRKLAEGLREMTMADRTWHREDPVERGPIDSLLADLR